MFEKIGLKLDGMTVQNLSLPEELQKILDQKIGMGMVGGDMGKFMQYQTAQAIPKFAEGAGGGGGIAGDAMSSFFVAGLDLAYVEPLIARVEGARERLAPLTPFTEIVGEIALGASGRRVPVVTGTMDAWSGVLGAGVRGPGQGVYMSGTSEIVAIASAQRIGAAGVEAVEGGHGDAVGVH